MVNGYKPTTLGEALEIRNTKDVVPYAGGTDLMVENRKDVSYLFLNHIPELKEIREDEQFIQIGAAVTFAEALESILVPSLMKEAIAGIAAPAIRNMGTFGGNIGNGSAKADSVLISFVADAQVRLLSVDEERMVDIDQFYRERKQLDLRSNELIAGIVLPKKGLDNYYYKKVGGRNALAISRVSFAGIIDMNGDCIRHIAAAFGAVSGTILRMKELEQMFEGKTLAQAKALKPQILKLYAEHMNLTQGRVSAEYRKAVCLNLLKDFLAEKGI